jgi:hypothetical protein
VVEQVVEVKAHGFGVASAPNDRTAYCCFAFSNAHRTSEGPAASPTAPHWPDGEGLLHPMVGRDRGLCSTLLWATIPVQVDSPARIREVISSAPDVAPVSCRWPSRSCIPSHLAATSELRPVPEPNGSASTGLLPLRAPRALTPKASLRREQPGMTCARSLPEGPQPGRFDRAYRCRWKQFLTGLLAAPPLAAQLGVAC